MASPRTPAGAARHWARWILLGGALLSVTATARAEEKAQALYDRGLAEMLEERYESGCPLIERSYALDPQPGALFTLAACYSRWGKVQTASARYAGFMALVERLPAAEREAQQDRVGAAREKIAELKGQIPTLTVTLGASAPNDVDVELDGRRLTTSEIGSPISVDPGAHQIVARRTGASAGRTISVSVAAGGSEQVDLSETLGAAVASEDPAEPDGTDEPASGDTLRAAGYAIGAVGLAGVAVGAITGGMVFGAKGTVNDNCVGNVCNQDGVDAADQATTLATVSNIGFGVGLGALAVGIVLVLVAPDDDSAESAARLPMMVAVGPAGRDGAAVGIVGRW